MQILNLPRARGKTTRAVIMSEHYKYPILALTKAQARIIKDRAKELDANIPEPISICDIPTCKNGLIIDEGIHTLLTLIRDKANYPIDIPLITLTVPKEDTKNSLEYIIQNLIGVQEMIQELPTNCEIGKVAETCEFISNKVKSIREEAERIRTV